MDLFLRHDDQAYSSAPQRRTRADNHATLLVSWWCTGCALVLILMRLWGRALRNGTLFREDKIMALGIIPLLARMALVDPIMLYGTNNVSPLPTSDDVIAQRELGSKLVLAARIFYALFIWMAKFTISEYLKRMTSHFWTRTYEVVLRSIRAFLVLTFFAVVAATLGECQPFNHYWQVVPDPGPQCRSGFAQVITMGTCDIITDILLVAFPISIVVRSAMPVKRKVSLSALFGLSILLIAITAYRVPTIINFGGLQQRRTLWASLEILAAAAVSNALILGSFVRDRGVKKKKKFNRYASYSRHESVTSVPRSALVRSMTQRHWGNDSDQDLFQSVAGRLDSVCYDKQAVAALQPYRDVEEACESDDDDDDVPRPRQTNYITSNGDARPAPPHEMQLFDIGGILDTPGPSQPSSSKQSSNSPRQVPVDHAPTTSAFDFADIGGLLRPESSLQHPDRQGSIMSSSQHSSVAPSRPYGRRESTSPSHHSQQSVDANTTGPAPTSPKRPTPLAEEDLRPQQFSKGHSLDLADPGGLLGGPTTLVTKPSGPNPPASAPEIAEDRRDSRTGARQLLAKIKGARGITSPPQPPGSPDSLPSPPPTGVSAPRLQSHAAGKARRNSGMMLSDPGGLLGDSAG